MYLPASLKRIGDYAFYMCRNLHTIHFRRELEYLGGGAFVWCRGLSRLTFGQVPREGHGIYSVLAELTQELETEIPRMVRMGSGCCMSRTIWLICTGRIPCW